MTVTPLPEPRPGRDELIEAEFPSPRDLCVAANRLILTRWVAAALVVLLSPLAARILDLRLPVAPLLVLGAAIAAYNAAFMWRGHSLCPGAGGAGLVRLRRFVLLQVALDWAGMAVFLHLTGGVTSPATVLFGIHILIVTSLMRRRAAYTSVGAGTALFAAVAVFEAAGWLPHHEVIPSLPAALHTDARYLLAQIAFFFVATFVIVNVVTLVMTRMRERDRQLAALLGAARAISSSLMLPEVLQRLAESAARAFSATGASIRLLDDSGENLSLAASYGLSDLYLAKGPVALSTSSLDREVLSARRPVVVADTRRDHRTQYPRELEAEGIASMLVLPLQGESAPLGVLRVYGSRPSQFGTTEADFGGAFGGQGAVALRNAVAHEKLQQLEEARARFVRTVTHELRAPINSALSMLTVMEGGYTGELNAQQRDTMLRLKARLDALLQLVNDLLVMAETRAPELQENPAVLDVTAAVAASADRHEPDARARALTLARELPPEPLRVRATPRGLQQIFDNLISNAIKYTPAGGSVTVRVRKDDGRATVEIADTGMGIPAGDLPRLWSEFFRAENARKSGIPGTGLGLSIVKRLVERWGGLVRVQTSEGAGTTFVITLPVDE